MPTYWLPIADELALKQSLAEYKLPSNYAVWPNLAEGPGGVRYLPVELDAPPSTTHIDRPPVADPPPASDDEVVAQLKEAVAELERRLAAARIPTAPTTQDNPVT